MIPRSALKEEARRAAPLEVLALQDGFTLGEWLIEPRDLRVSSGDVVVEVTAPQMQVLVCLVESKGAFVDRRTLRSRVYPHEPRADKQLRDAIAAWHGVFGDSSRHPRYVAANGRDGYSIIARLEPTNRKPVAERLVTAGLRRSGVPGPRQSLVSFAHGFLAELRRRRVFQVSASYLIGMWLLLQVAEVTFAPLHFPAWWVTALTTTKSPWMEWYAILLMLPPPRICRVPAASLHQPSSPESSSWLPSRDSRGGSRSGRYGTMAVSCVVGVESRHQPSPSPIAPVQRTALGHGIADAQPKPTIWVGEARAQDPSTAV